MSWRRCGQGVLAFLVALGLALGGFTALGGRAAPAVVTTIPVGGEPFSIAANPTTNRVYVANAIDGTISVINSTTNTVVATIPINGASGGDLEGVAVDPTTNRVYADYVTSSTCIPTCQSITNVAVIDGATNTITTTIPVGSGTNGGGAPGFFGVAVNPATHRVYVTVDTGASGVAVIDGATNTVVTTVPLPGSPVSLAVNPTTNRIYVLYAAGIGSALAVLDGGTNTVITSVPLSATPSGPPSGVAVNPVTNRVYVASAVASGPSSINGALLVVDGGSNAIVATVPVDGAPIGVAVNTTTDTVYLASIGFDVGSTPSSGSLVVVDGGTNAVTATVPLSAPAVGVAVNPSTGSVYVTLINILNPSGNGSVAILAERKVGLSASALAFGNQPVGLASAAQTVTLTNTGQGTVDVSGVTIAGANSGDFVKASDTCTAATLAAGATCSVGVAFAPTAVGNRSATLIFTDDAGDSPQRVTLTGAGTPAPVGWSAWQSLGGVLTDAPAAAGLNGNLYVFAAGTDHALYVRSSADGSAFTTWQRLGGILTAAPAAASNNGKLYVFAKGSDNALYVMSTADGATWTGWTRLGGILTAPPAATSVNGTLYVLAKGSDNALYVMHSTNGTTWSSWQDLGGVLTAAPAAAGLNGTLYVFAKGTDNALYQRSSANGVEFTPWHSLGGVLTAAPAAASFTPTGGVATLYTFATGTDHALYVRSSTDGVTWSAWLTLGGQLVGPPAAAGVGDTLYAVVRWSDNTLYERFLR